MKNKTSELGYLLDGYVDIQSAIYLALKNQWLKGKVFKVSELADNFSLTHLANIFSILESKNVLEVFNYQKMINLREYLGGKFPVYQNDIWEITLIGEKHHTYQSHVYNWPNLVDKVSEDYFEIKIRFLSEGSFRIKSEEKSLILNTKAHVKQKYEDLADYLRYRPIKQKVAILHQLKLSDLAVKPEKEINKAIDEMSSRHMLLGTENVQEIEMKVENVIHRLPVDYLSSERKMLNDLIFQNFERVNT